jgi:hypothetical protein
VPLAQLYNVIIVSAIEPKEILDITPIQVVNPATGSLEQVVRKLLQIDATTAQYQLNRTNAIEQRMFHKKWRVADGPLHWTQKSSSSGQNCFHLIARL